MFHGINGNGSLLLLYFTVVLVWVCEIDTDVVACLRLVLVNMGCGF